MKSNNKLYYTFTYIFFILPPFIWGLVEIYRGIGAVLDAHVQSLIINIIVYILIALICGLLIYKKKLHIPTVTERKYLLFGFIGNIIVYFYTFQNMMNIENLVTVYLSLLLILVVHYLLISRTFRVKELWLFMIAFLVIDLLHLAISGCGFNDYWRCDPNAGSYPFLYVLYTLMIILSVGFYGYKIYKQNQWDFFKIANAILIVLASFLIQEFFDIAEEFLLTIGILLPFLTIVDFIVKIVNKRYSHRMVVFYIRTYTIWLMFALMFEEDFFYGKAGYNILAIMVVITYISLVINLFKGVLGFKEEEDLSVTKTTFRKLAEEDLKAIEENYGKVQKDHMLLDEHSYSLVAIQEGKIIGMISSYINDFPKVLNEKEAYMNIIEVHEEYRNKGIASELVKRTEHYFRGKVYQLRGWSSDDKTEAIKLWKKLKYNLSPTVIHIEEKGVNVKGLYFSKKL